MFILSPAGQAILARWGFTPVAATGRLSEMRILACAFAILLALSAPAAAERLVTDSAGRQVAVPDRIERVFAAGPPASVLVYALAPDKLTGWSRAPSAVEREFLAAPYRDLPEQGRLTGRGDTANLEVVLAAKPDLILDFGSIGDTYVSLADRVRAQTGVPYLLIDGRFANTAAALRLTGAILGVPARAEQLAAYAEATFAAVDTVLAKVPAGAAATGLSGPRSGRIGDRARRLDQHRDRRAGRWQSTSPPAGPTGKASPRSSSSRSWPGIRT